MKLFLYQSIIAALGYVAWLYAFRFELLLPGAIGGAYLIFLGG